MNAMPLVLDNCPVSQLLAVDGYLPLVCDKMKGEMLSECFKPSVSGWNPANSQYS